MKVPGAEELLSSAWKVLITISDGNIDIDKTPQIDGDTLSCELSEQETSYLSLGTIYIEATIVNEEKVYKTATVKTKMIEAIKDAVML